MNSFTAAAEAEAVADEEDDDVFEDVTVIMVEGATFDEGA